MNRSETPPVSTERLRRSSAALIAPFVALVAGVAIGPVGGCASSPETAACRTGAECASGVCFADGTCSRAAFDAGPAPLRDGGGGLCVPNADGVIARSEFPVEPGLRATYAYAANVAVDLAGRTLDGVLVWDFRGPYASDATRTLDVRATSGAWWAASFPDASYALPLDGAGTLFGAFRLANTELALLGVLSSADGPTKTHLSYSPAPAFLRFPLTKGASWTTTSTVTGTAQGLAFAEALGTHYTETYATTVDAAGEVTVPFGTFKVLRVLTSLARRNQFGMAIPALPDRKTVAFVAECFGTVASATSRDGEVAPLFSIAAELQRLAP